MNDAENETSEAIYHETQRLARLSVVLWKRATPNSRKRTRAIVSHVRKLDAAWQARDLVAIAALISEGQTKWRKA